MTNKFAQKTTHEDRCRIVAWRIADPSSFGLIAAAPTIRQLAQHLDLDYETTRNLLSPMRPGYKEEKRELERLGDAAFIAKHLGPSNDYIAFVTSCNQTPNNSGFARPSRNNNTKEGTHHVRTDPPCRVIISWQSVSTTYRAIGWYWFVVDSDGNPVPPSPVALTYGPLPSFGPYNSSAEAYYESTIVFDPLNSPHKQRFDAATQLLSARIEDAIESHRALLDRLTEYYPTYQTVMEAAMVLLVIRYLESPAIQINSELSVKHRDVQPIHNIDLPNDTDWDTIRQSLFDPASPLDPYRFDAAKYKSNLSKSDGRSNTMYSALADLLASHNIPTDFYGHTQPASDDPVAAVESFVRHFKDELLPVYHSLHGNDHFLIPDAPRPTTTIEPATRIEPPRVVMAGNGDPDFYKRRA